MSENNNIKGHIIEYCSKIGNNPLLIQGAGGNISWKDNGTLWVKASGTWLSDASENNIFVPVDLLQLRKAIKNGDFSVTPTLSEETTLRPSIETLLHALMPHRVVVHLHAIEVLSHLVRDNCHIELHKIIDKSIRWTIVEYHKPGAGLAAAVNNALIQTPSVDVVFLKNHGIVIGGDDISNVRNILDNLTMALSVEPVNTCEESLPIIPSIFGQHNQYSPLEDRDIQQLAINPNLFSRLRSDWALYPDHVVFLGHQAFTYRSWEDFEQQNKDNSKQPELIFILGKGVFVKPTFNQAKYAQLRCYFDVLARQNSNCPVKALDNSQISELLNWDAEQYRMSISK